MPTRNVALTGHQDKIIETLVQSGRYGSAGDVWRAFVSVHRAYERVMSRDTAEPGGICCFIVRAASRSSRSVASCMIDRKSVV